MIPKPGLYPDVPADTYHRKWDAASNSRLSLLKRSPAHMRYAVDNPDDPTPAKIIGTAVHDLVLLPELFNGRYITPQRCGAVTGKGEICRNNGSVLSPDGAVWLCGTHTRGLTGCLPPAKTILSHNDYAAVKAMAEAVHVHPEAERLFCAGLPEVSAFWTDPVTTCPCKLRADWLAEDVEIVADIKTTDDASPEGFERSILRYGYHRQAAWYLHGLNELGRAFQHFVFVCVESSPPYAVGLYRLDDEAIAAGEAELADLLGTYAACCKSGNWPAYPTNVQTISLPDFYLRRLTLT